MFDKLLGITQDPEIEQIKSINPLHNYDTPDSLKANLGPNHE